MIFHIRGWFFTLLAAAIFMCLGAAGWAQEQKAFQSTADALHDALVERHSSGFANGAPDPLFDFYAARNFAPAWTGPKGDGNAVAVVLSTLTHADAQGLRAQDYSITASRWDAIPETGPEAAAFELSLTADLMHYAADVRLGRVNPTTVYQDVELPAGAFEFVAALNTALRGGRIERFLAGLPPQQPDYQGLVQGLANYRLQEARGGWVKIAGGGEIALDGSDPRSRALIARLSQEDPVLAANAAPSADDVRNGLTQFQTRNGLQADGRAGGQTLAALNIPVGQRISQIIANMERWRWMQRKFEDSYILVNVPDQTAKFITHGDVLLETRAIVGKLSSKTPIARMVATTLVINPPWHVPEDIAAAQILPKLRQNPNYLATRNMVLADGPPDDPQGRTIPWRTMKAMPYLVDQKSRS